MNAKKFSDAMSELDTKYVDEALNYKKKEKKPAWMKWGAMAACLCAIVMVAIPVIQHYNYVTDNEPQRELTVAEAISYEPLGALYPETILDGYVLEDNTVKLYDEAVMKAVYYNDSIGDVLTITIAAKEYFGDVEQDTILQDKNGGTRIYLESGNYMVAYYFSTQDIASIENFEEMVTSSASFKNRVNSENEPVEFNGQLFNKSTLSEETLKWLEWYNSLPPEEQLAVSSIPAELDTYDNSGTVDADTAK